MSENEHRDEVRKHQAHKPGCIVRCESDYLDGNTCSHRWQAAKQARSEKRVPYGDTRSGAAIIIASASRLARLLRIGGVWGGRTGTDAAGRTTGRLLPFREKWWPFYHNAHHIIPVSTLWGSIETVAQAADPNSSRMLELVIGTLLEEPYNLNDQPNMIVLPTEYKVSFALGLPQHTDGGKPDHPNYRKQVATFVDARFPPKFQSLASAVKNEKHVEDQETPKVREMLEGISKATYEAIIAVGMVTAKRGDDVNLDSTAEKIGELASATLAG